MGEARVLSLEGIRRYGGMHAVLVGGEIVAASGNPAEAYRAAVERHPGKKVEVACEFKLNAGGRIGQD